ncbi:MAG: (2Fe-2S)-binding protein [Thermomicrobiales bacterium]|jgi:nicotinate dehydrogenase subunit A|nr:(2Fe-2S)-binding protein [Thermomicrobiales bacterium]MDF3043124.1 (2Fe-2S)-binding protein [Thermomicrobiales bacterium]
MAEMRLTVNGQVHQVEADPDSPLLYILRNQLELNGPQFGCGLVQCGACTVLVDGKAARSCQTPISAVGDREVVTLEGLGTEENPSPIQQAFIDEQAVQCGYCINGMIMTAHAFLKRNANPSAADIRKALAGNLCRCGTHVRIVRAVQRVVTEAAEV